MITAALDQILADGNQAGVFHVTESIGDIEKSGKTAGLRVIKIKLAREGGKNGLLTSVAQALKFPNYFSKNWDALNDCLTDLQWLKDEGWILILENCKTFAGKHREDFDKAVQVFTSATEYWKSQGKPFWVFVAAPGGWDCGLRRFPPGP